MVFLLSLTHSLSFSLPQISNRHFINDHKYTKKRDFLTSTNTYEQMNTLKIVINPHSSLLRTQTRQNTEHQRSCTITHQINKSEQLPGSTKRRLLNSNCRYYLFPLRGVAGVINSSRKWSKATVHFGSGRALWP